MKEIVFKRDPDLRVYIDRGDPGATVLYSYGDWDLNQPTPYQTADMPLDDQEAAEMINSYLDI
jgi:hypothetical protein